MATIIPENIDILAVGMSGYDGSAGYEALHGIEEDISTIESLFSELYSKEKITKLMNSKGNDLRNWIIGYSRNRGRKGDVLIFYYAGHGCVTVDGDFGFCPIDVTGHIETQTTFSLGILSFKDVIQTLTAASVYPVFIIDACYSGRAAASAPVGTTDVLYSMGKGMIASKGDSAALLCSCQSEETARGDEDGGFFTNALFEAAIDELEDRTKEFVGLSDIGSLVMRKTEEEGNALPLVFVGSAFPKIPITRNPSYKQSKTATEGRIRFEPYMAKLINFLWNNKQPKSASLREIQKSVGAGAYGNHRKLSYEPWKLLAGPSSGRFLTDRGKDFAQGKLEIPSYIYRDADGNWKPDVKERSVRIDDVFR